MALDPGRIHRELLELLTTTRCIRHYDDEGTLHIEPLLQEEAEPLAHELTVHILDRYTERSA